MNTFRKPIARRLALLGVFSLSLATSAWAALTPALDENYPARYMGADTPLITAPNGAVTNQHAFEVAQKIVYTEPTVEQLSKGVWVIGGHSIVNCYVIEAPDGLIVYDTGDNAEEGKHFREVIEQQISKKPIKAIIYSHSHYAMGGGAMVDDPKSVMVIGHPLLNDTVQTNLQAGGAPAAIPELGPVLTARALMQFGMYMPKEGEDAWLSARIEFKPTAFLPATVTPRDGETLNVAGLKMQFFTEIVTDDHTLTVLIPSTKTVLNNVFWPGTPNLYSLRGAVYRDPQAWRDGLKLIRDLQPEVLLNTHARAITGKDTVHQALLNYMDLISLTYDQSLRGILHGLGPDALRYFVYEPKHLADDPNNAQSYGETSWFTPAMYYYQLGWYDGEPSNLYRLPPKDEATRLVALMGGTDKVITAARTAFDNKEYAWAAQLINYVYTIDPQDKVARQLLADAARKLGQLAPSSIGRGFAISVARALEGKEEVARLSLPRPAIIAANPAEFVNYQRVRIDPRKSEEVDKVIAFAFPQKTVALHVRRGVVEYIPDPSKYLRKSDITLKLDGDTWAQLYLNQTDLTQAVKDGKVQVAQGDAGEAAQIMDLFDKFDSAQSLLVPPAQN